MQDEELDKMINDAANQHHPPYDDKAWGKMAALLNEHLPQKKDRKKFVFWLFLFLLLGGAVVTGILQPWKKPAAAAAMESTMEKKLPNSGKQNYTAPAAANNDIAIKNNTTDNNTTATIPKQTTGTNVAPVYNNSNKLIQNDTLQGTGKYIVQPGNNKATIYKRKGRFAVKVKKPAAVAGEEERNFKNDVTRQNTSPEKNNEAAAEPSLEEPEKKDAVAKLTGIANKEEKDSAKAPTDSAKSIPAEKEKLAAEKKSSSPEKNKKDKSFTSNFAITVSAGADVSYISISNAGKLKPLYGAGIRYNMGKHFTVSSGLYISKKIYTASPSQYIFASGYPNPNLININANCKIYEIPLTVYYNFKQTKNHNWFGALGLSSYLMKKETYDYMYKYPSGQSWSYVKEVSNENEHYFSVLTISGGYQYKLSKYISFLAEPYLKLPLNSGVGLGKVKLNSAGLLFTAVVKPFAKKK